MRPQREYWTKWLEADFSRSFNQPHDHMILTSISNFQIRVDQAIQRDLLIPPPTKNQDEKFINSRSHSVGFWRLKEWKNWHQNMVWVLLELAHLASYNIQMRKIQFIFHSNETWWDHFSDHLLYPLVNDFLEAETNQAAGCPNIIHEDNKALQPWCSSIVNPWAEANPENQDESLVSVSNTNPNFAPKTREKCGSHLQSLQSSCRLDGDLCFFCRTPTSHHICASRISEPEMKGAI